MEKLFEKIDSFMEAYTKILEDVVCIESPTVNKSKVDEVGKYFINLASENGWETEIKEFEEFGDVVTITMNKNAPGSIITLSGHMDTVHPIGVFGEQTIRREGDKLFGPGTVDCKGGIVAGLLAMKALSDIGYKDRPVMMILQSNEEIGSPKTIDYICEKAKDSIAFLNLEGHEKYFEGKACLKRKGIARFLFEVEGIETHSSYCAREGANAIAEAAHKILELEKIKNNDGLTFNCGVIEGGTTPNTVPGSCKFKLDVRFATNKEYEEAKEIVKRVSETNYINGCITKVSQISMRVAMELNDRNIELLNKANKIFAQNGLSELEIGERAGGSDASNISSYGIPCLDSIGIGGERAHSVEEFALVSSMAESAKRIGSIIIGL